MCKYRQYIHKYSTINPQISLRNLYGVSSQHTTTSALIWSEPESRFCCRESDVQASRGKFLCLNSSRRSPEPPLVSACAPYRPAGGNFCLEVIKIAKITPIWHKNSTKLFHNVHWPFIWSVSKEQASHPSGSGCGRGSVTEPATRSCCHCAILSVNVYSMNSNRHRRIPNHKNSSVGG